MSLLKIAKRHCWHFLLDEDGPTAVEYAVMLALILVACMASVHVLAAATSDSFNASAEAILNATS